MIKKIVCRKKLIKLWKWRHKKEISGILTHDVERRRRLRERRRIREVWIWTLSLRGRCERWFRNQFRTPMYRFLHATGRRWCGALRFRSRSQSGSLRCGGFSVRGMKFDVRFRLRLFHDVEFKRRRSGWWRRVEARFEVMFKVRKFEGRFLGGRIWKANFWLWRGKKGKERRLVEFVRFF